MEKSLINYLKEELNLKKIDVRTYSPLALAYIGDSVYELIIRTMILSEGNSSVNKYHKRASSYAKANAQANMIKVIEPILTAEEILIYKRGRNAKSVTVAKNASMIDYRMATGFEALIGYLYLEDNMTRVIEIIKYGLQQEKKNEQ